MATHFVAVFLGEIMPLMLGKCCSIFWMFAMQAHRSQLFCKPFCLVQLNKLSLYTCSLCMCIHLCRSPYPLSSWQQLKAHRHKFKQVLVQVALQQTLSTTPQRSSIFQLPKVKNIVLLKRI